MRFLTSRTLERWQTRYEGRLSMLCDIYRDESTGEYAPGYPRQYDMQPYLTDVKCYVWNLLYLLQGEFTFPEREYATGQLRGLLPHDLEIKEQDDIRNIRDADGNVKFPGPLNIALVVPHSVFTLLVLRGSH